MTTLQKRIHTLVRQVLDSYEGAWLTWCDPRGDWLPLLQRVAQDTRMGGFPLLAITETTAGEIGGPRARQQVQERIDRGESFVLLIAAPLEPAAGSGGTRCSPSRPTPGRCANSCLRGAGDRRA